MCFQVSEVSLCCDIYFFQHFKIHIKSVQILGYSLSCWKAQPILECVLFGQLTLLFLYFILLFLPGLRALRACSMLLPIPSILGTHLHSESLLSRWDFVR